MAFDRSTDVTNNISLLPDRPTISATSLKQKFDQIGQDLKAFINNSLFNQLESATPGDSGAENIGSAPISGLSGATVHSQLSSLTGYDGANVKLTGNQTVAGIKTFTSSPIVPTPVSGTAIANKDYVDSTAAGIPLGIVPDRSITEMKQTYSLFNFDAFNSALGGTKVTKFDYPLAGNITETITVSAVVKATKTTVFDSPSAGDITETVVYDTRTYRKITVFGTDITETVTEV